MNLLQKSVMSVSVCLALIAVFLHNPISGYTLKNNNDFHLSRPCSSDDYKNLRRDYGRIARAGGLNGKSAKEVEADIEATVAACENTIWPGRYLPVGEWASDEPHVYWLGSIINLLFTLATIGAMSGAVLYLFRDKPTE